MDKKKILFVTLDDLVSNFLYYDRKEDKELSVYDLENLIASKHVTIEELVEAFKISLIKTGMFE